MTVRPTHPGGRQPEQLALVVVDVLSDYEHADAEELMASAEETVHRTVSLVEAARERSILIVYVNDNFPGLGARSPAPVSLRVMPQDCSSG